MMEIIAIAVLFIVRVGVPVLALVFLGIMIDRWQTNREAQIKRQYKRDVEIDFKVSETKAQKDEQTRKAA